MKRLVALAVLVLGSGAFAIAAPTTVTGVLVDKACYTKDKANTTNAHKGMGDTCAQDCAKKGQQVALVTSTGDVYDVKGEVAADIKEKLYNEALDERYKRWLLEDIQKHHYIEIKL